MNSICQQLDDYLDGSLPSQMAARFDEHVAVCPACRQAVYFERAMEHAARRAASRVRSPATRESLVELRTNRLRRRRLAWGFAVVAAVSVTALMPLRSFVLNRGAARSDLGAPSVAESSGIVSDSPSVESRGFMSSKAHVSSNGQHIAMQVPTENDQVTFVMLYPTIPGSVGTSSEQSPPANE